MKVRELVSLLQKMPSEAEVDIELHADVDLSDGAFLPRDADGYYIGGCRSVYFIERDGVVVLSQ